MCKRVFSFFVFCVLVCVLTLDVADACPLKRLLRARGGQAESGTSLCDPAEDSNPEDDGEESSDEEGLESAENDAGDDPNGGLSKEELEKIKKDAEEEAKKLPNGGLSKEELEKIRKDAEEEAKKELAAGAKKEANAQPKGASGEKRQ